MVDAYTSAQAKIKQAYALLSQAQRELDLAFSDSYGMFDVIDRFFTGTDPERSYKDIELKIRRRAWRGIVEKTGIRKLLSVKRAELLDKQLYDGVGTPDEVTLCNVLAMLQMAADNTHEFAQESVREVFDFLRPARYVGGQRHKTNKANGRYSLGRRIILTGALRYSMGYRVNNYYQPHLIAVDRIFHMLDGKLGSFHENGYVCPLIDAIQTADGAGETPYFKFKMYMNGNLHLEFRRLDLVSKLNELGGNKTELKG